MKICEYCNSDCEDGVSACPACGGNSFIHICNNCGNRFRDAFCPNCGVKAGVTARVCPRCGTSYFSAACPTCGYLPGAQNNGAYQNSGQPYQQNQQPYQQNQPPYQQQFHYQQTPTPAKKSSHLVLWILGWLFCFPIPLTILIARSKLPKLVKILLIAALWIFVVFVGGRY